METASSTAPLSRGTTCRWIATIVTAIIELVLKILFCLLPLITIEVSSPDLRIRLHKARVRLHREARALRGAPRDAFDATQSSRYQLDLCELRPRVLLLQTATIPAVSSHARRRLAQPDAWHALQRRRQQP